MSRKSDTSVSYANILKSSCQKKKKCRTIYFFYSLQDSNLKAEK